jgi:hypothetical protein
MLRSSTALAFALAALSLTACDRIFPKRAAEPAITTEPAAEPAAPVLEARPAVTVSTASVNWDAARADFAAQPAPDDDNVRVASGGEPPPVPVFLPGGDTVSAASGNVVFQPLKDGYFANIPGPAYNMVINGTNRVAGTGEATAARPEGYRFETTSTGAMVAFSKYNVDYLVEFECNEAGPTGTCIEEADALRIAQEMVLAGVR